MANAGTIVVGLIARTENFEKGMRRGQNATKGFSANIQLMQRQMQQAQRFLLSGGILRGIQGIADGITAVHEALRKSDLNGLNLFSTFVDALPIIGSVNQSLDRMLKELTGIKEAEEGIDLFGKIQAEAEDLRKKTSNDLELANANSKDRDRILAKQKYLDKLEKIAKLEAVEAEARKSYPGVKQDFGKDRAKALELYNKQLDNLANQPLEKLQKVLQGIENELKGIDEWTQMLADFANSADFTPKKYMEMLKVVDEIHKTEKALEERDKEKEPKIAEKEKLLPDAHAIEVSRSVSIQGMSIGGVVDKQAETNRLLQDMNRILNETKNLLVMN